MENLEKELKKVEIDSAKVYDGLTKLEDTKYKGPTSIKYWM